MTVETRDERFLRWFNDHQGIAIKVARSFASTQSDTEDLVQEILIRLWRSADSFRGDSKESTWIYRVALNCGLTWKRDRGRRPQERPLAELGDLAVLSDHGAGEDLAQLYELIRMLRPIDRSLLIMSLDGFTYAEMAQVTEMTESNVGARLTRARNRLSELMKETNND